MIRSSYGVATSTGRVRKVNEDSYLALPLLFAVADGMGGHGAGDVASALAIEVLTTRAQVGTLTVDTVLAALDEANRVIMAGDEADGMGTTITGLAVLETAGGSHLMVFNVGDSRVYRLAGGHLHQLTVDHSEVQELVRAGALTREQARTHPRRNIVTRALGSDSALPDYWLLPAIAGDRYLLCSDGLFGELVDESICALALADDPQQAAASLVAAANDAGGRDNITVIIVDIDADDDNAADDTTTPRDQLPSVDDLCELRPRRPDRAGGFRLLGLGRRDARFAGAENSAT